MFKGEAVFSYGNELQNNKEEPSHQDTEVEDGFDCQTMTLVCEDEPVALTGAVWVTETQDSKTKLILEHLLYELMLAV